MFVYRVDVLKKAIENFSRVVNMGTVRASRFCRSATVIMIRCHVMEPLIPFLHHRAGVCCEPDACFFPVGLGGAGAVDLLSVFGLLIHDSQRPGSKRQTV